MTLTKAASPYYGGTTIETGATVTAEPGAEVRLGYGTPIIVNGTLKAEGTSEDPVVFTSEEEDEYFNWKGLLFNSGSGASVLDHVVVRYAGGSWGRAIEVKKASPTIEHSVIRNNFNGGIFVTEGGSPEIVHNTLLKNGAASAIYYSSNEESTGEVNIHDNLIEGGSSGGISIYESGPVVGGTVAGNTIKNTGGAGITYGGDDIPADLDENILEGNSSNAIWISGTISKSASWTDHGYPFIMSNGDTYVDLKATLSLGPGLTIKSDSWWSLKVKGTLKAEGSVEDPILFTTNTAFHWPGIVFESGSGNSVMRHVEVTKAGTKSESAIKIKSASPTIEDCTIRESDYGAISVQEGGSPEIANNYIQDSGGYAGIRYESNEKSTGEVNIHDNLIEGGYGGGISVYESGPVVGVSVGGNTVEGNEDSGISYNGDEIPADLDENTLKENGNNAIWVSGTISNSMTWTDHGYPFILGNDLTVGSEATLSIGPGFTTKSDSWWSIIVNGTLKAEGTSEDPVVFTSNTSYNWPGLVFKSGSDASVLSHAEVRRAGVSWGSAIKVDNASPTISHSTIKGSYYYGILIKHGGAPDIGNNRIENNGESGIAYNEAEAYSGEVNIHDNLLERNGEGIDISTGSNVSAGILSGNTLRENDSAMSFSGGEVPPDLTDNKLIANKYNSIYVSGTVEQSGIWFDPGGPIIVGTLTVAGGAALVVQPGVAFEGGTFTINGTLIAEGTEEEPVLFNPVGKSQWAGLSFESGSGASVLDYVEVVQGGNWSSGKAITIKESSPTITNSMIRESSNYGIYVPSGSPTIEGNRFRKNPYAVVYEGKGNLSAPNNDWGCKGGPGSSGCDAVWNVEWKPATTLPDLPRPCVPGSKQPGPSLDCLLYRYAPELRYDSQESFLANSAAEITDNWGDASTLWGESGEGAYTNKMVGIRVGEFGLEEPDLAYSRPGLGGSFRLTLDSLGKTYPNSEAATEADYLDEVEHGEENYVEDDHKLVAREYLNRSYGRVVKGGTGKIWLQYWYFYYYNSLDVEGFGLHEGDWEEVQVGLDEKQEPDVVVFSQHGGGGSCDLFEFQQTENGAPIVYVALGSHANYPVPGQYGLPFLGSDYANGKGPAITPSIEVLGDELPNWLEWPGHWGNSRSSNPLEQESPTGPKQHSEWDPEDFALNDVHECLATYEESERRSMAAVAAPRIGSTDFEGKHPVVSYKLPDGGRKESGSRLVLSVREKGSDLPPLTKTIKRPKASGNATLPFKLHSDRDVVILASVLDRYGHRSRVVRRIEEAG